jgi:polyhydroxybutyrate depolymerase
LSLKTILALALSALAAPAAACPGSDAPCEVAGGSYRAEAPEGPVRGALLFLHGWGGTAEGVLADRRLAAPALARDYVMLAPQGVPRRRGESGGRWNARYGGETRDDVAFLRRVLDDAAIRFGFDRDQVLAAGFSGGGMMVWRLACDAPEAAGAFAPVAGLFWRPLPKACSGAARLMHTHGWSDPVVPLEGRPVGDGTLTQGDLFEGLALMRRTNRCADDRPDRISDEPGRLRRDWTDCAASLALVLHPDGHVVPEGWTDLALDWLEAR